MNGTEATADADTLARLVIRWDDELDQLADAVRRLRLRHPNPESFDGRIADRLAASITAFDQVVQPIAADLARRDRNREGYVCPNGHEGRKKVERVSHGYVFLVCGCKLVEEEAAALAGGGT
jgi:hypothetical protein